MKPPTYRHNFTFSSQCFIILSLHNIYICNKAGLVAPERARLAHCVLYINWGIRFTSNKTICGLEAIKSLCSFTLNINVQFSYIVIASSKAQKKNV